MPTYLEERVQEGFLFFPKAINGKIKWLLRARWVEVFQGWKYVPSGDMMECGGYAEDWKATSWSQQLLWRRLLVLRYGLQVRLLPEQLFDALVQENDSYI